MPGTRACEQAVLRPLKASDFPADTPAVEQSSAIEIFLNGVAQFWYLWLLIGGYLSCVPCTRCGPGIRLARSGIKEIDRMDGRTFERRLTLLFQRLGYQVEQVGRRGDYGAGSVVRRNGTRTVIQAKRWTRNVGIKAVQEANAAPAVYACSGAMVVTNRYFTESARKLAGANGVVLWDRDRLVKALLAARNS